MFKSLLFSSLL